MREVPESFAEELQRFDPELRARFAYLQMGPPWGMDWRWIIERHDRVNGRWNRVTTVRGPDNGYRPLDGRIFHDLAKADMWRFANFNRWQKGTADAFMESLGLEKDPATETLNDFMARKYRERYDPGVAEMHEKLHHYLKTDPKLAGMSEPEMAAHLKRLEDDLIVEWCRQVGRGRLVKSKEHGGVIAVPGTY